MTFDPDAQLSGRGVNSGGGGGGRGGRGIAIGGGSIGGILVIVVVSLIFGVNPADLLGAGMVEAARRRRAVRSPDAAPAKMPTTRRSAGCRVPATR